jgi:Predicted ester cyclase
MADSEQQSIERRLLTEVWGKGNLDVTHEILAEDFVRHGPDVEGGQTTGREAFKALVTSYRTGLPDLDVPIDELFEIGDRVITRWHATGTNTGQVLGQDPTGRTVNISGQHMLRFAGGRIAEEWVAYDALGLVQQLGLNLPELPA